MADRYREPLDKKPEKESGGCCGCPWKASSYVKLLALLLVVGGLVFLIIYYYPEINKFAGNGGTLQTFVKKIGFWGYVVYAGVYIVFTVAFIPGSALTLGAGLVFHTDSISSLFVAFAVVSVGSVIGASCAFLLGRFVLQSWVQKRIVAYPKFKAVERAIGDNGFKMTLLLRLSPIFPFNLLNYGLGVTTVPFIKYLFASWIGMAPGTFLYVFIGWSGAAALSGGGKHGSASGSASGSLAVDNTKSDLLKDILLYGVGGVVTILVVVLVTIYARRNMQKYLVEDEDETAGGPHPPARADSSINTEAKPLLRGSRV